MNEQTQSAAPRRRGLWTNTVRRYRRNSRAMVGLVIMAVMIVVALLAPILAPEGYDAQNLDDAFISPCVAHPFGTDNLGRDVLVRVMYGAQISLRLGLLSVAISVVGGVVIGAVAGYYGGRIDNFFMRVMDVFQAIPPMLLAIAIAAILGPGLTNAMIAIGISGVPGFARLIRASILSVRENEYIEAARAVTATDARIIVKHILPNILSPILVQTSLSIANAILVASSLSFIGLGAQPPLPEWGAMISGARGYIRDYWYLVTLPGVAIILAVVSFNLIGDGIRDALDPRLSR